MASRKTARFTLLAMLMVMVGCGGTASEEVVVYSSVDDVFARPIAERFEQETGIVVRLVPDTEEAKSTGLVNREVHLGYVDRSGSAENVRFKQRSVNTVLVWLIPGIV